MSMTQSGKLTLSSTNSTETVGGQTATFTQVNFPTPFPAGSDVIVQTTVQTFNGPETPGVRLHNVSPTGFLIRLNEIYGGGISADGKHSAETIGWTAYTV
uniref:H-type lectin domain-containing protein n=1 Tax=Streptomyces sp. NBC_00049 TaxID=2903617 RepID=A0AAU2K2Q1_9ACTN